MTDEIERELFSTTDAEVWAKHFQNVIEKNPLLVKDLGFLIGWFANAIVRGRDAAEAEVSEDRVRQIEKGLDVLRKVETMMQAEATMNATKHLAEVVRPVPLAGAVSSLIGDYEAWLTRVVHV